MTSRGIPGERRMVTAASVVTLAATLAVAVAALAARNSREPAAVTALAVGIGALAVACAGLAAYILWVRRSVTTRMVLLLRRYVDPRVVATSPVPASPVATSPVPPPERALAGRDLARPPLTAHAN